MPADQDISVETSVATSARNLAAAPELLKELNAGIPALLDGGSEELRQDLSLKARDLMLALETPRETSIKHIWGDTGATGALTWGVEIGLWKLMARNGDRSQKVDELASQLGADPRLLARLMRHLGAMGYLKETGADEYEPTNFTKALSLDMIGDAYVALPGCTGAAQLRLYEFSREHNWQTVTDPNDTARNHAYNTETGMFEWWVLKGAAERFNNHMRGYRQGRKPWMDPTVCPVKDILFKWAETSPDTPLLVDIGGNVGHDLEEFLKYYPDHPGKLVLQDVPVVIGKIENLDPTIQRMEYDFFTEQPIKGARAYYMHSCLHDWPDDVCVKILSRVKEAMKPGYSKLLINENVIPVRGAWWEASGLDMTMMALCNSLERTELDWENLLVKRAGLKINKIFNYGRGVESLIELELQ